MHGKNVEGNHCQGIFESFRLQKVCFEHERLGVERSLTGMMFHWTIAGSTHNNFISFTQKSYSGSSPDAFIFLFIH
jgi:hypothetical protein